MPSDPARPPRLLAVLGPTAAGKSALGLELAARLDGEILCCDSVQVYRGFDIGSGKPTPAEQGQVPHHLLDVVDPSEPFDAARWAAAARAAMASVAGRSRLPIVVGGTGLYFRALVRGLFDAPPSDPVIRARHQQEAQQLGVDTLHRRLAEVDPESAARIRGGDLVRISRALEIHEQTGVALSALHRTAAPPAPIACFSIVLQPPQADLRDRVSTRVDAMLAGGWLEEVRALRDAGFGATRPMQSLGYRQLGQHLDGQVALADAVVATKQATAAYARRQRTWFHKEEASTRIEARPDVDRLLGLFATWADLS